MSQLAIFSHRIQITPTTWSYFFTPESPVDFAPGQYLRWTAPIDQDTERGNKRFFTISSLPGEDMISFTTRFFETVSPFKAFLQELRGGEALGVSNPMGDFTLPDDAEIPVVMLAGGIGVTPFRSMLLTSLPSYPARIIQLVHAAKDPAELAFRHEFDKLGTNYPQLNIRYYSPVAGESITQGNISVEHVMSHAPIGCVYYISGPELFVEALKSDLLSSGILENDIKTDYFPGYSEI